MNRNKTLAACAVAAAAAAIVVPALATGHATVSPMQPQGQPLTGARTLYVLRVPNEDPQLGTWKVTMQVPAAVQQRISVKKVAGWSTKLRLRGSGEDAAVTAITWKARSKSSEIDPHFFEEFPIRIQNPATPGELCFPTKQYYRKSAKRRAGGEIVRWYGAPDSEHPASCVQVVETPAS